MHCTFSVTGSINYLYTRLKFDWTEYEYTVYTSTAVVVGTLTQVLLIPLLSLRFKMRDITIGVIGTISGLAKNLVLAFACKWWMMYIGKGTHYSCYPNKIPTVIVFLCRLVCWGNEHSHLCNHPLHGLKDCVQIRGWWHILTHILPRLSHPHPHRPGPD